MAKRAAEPRLLGTWQSDRRRTFRHFRPSLGCPGSSFRKLKSLFGRMVIKWSPKYYETELDGVRSKYLYEVIAQDADSVVIRSENELQNGEQQLLHVHFHEHWYWISVSGTLHEWFRRAE